jgi:hypothetical protein
VAGDEVGMQVSFKDVPDAEILIGGGFQVEINVALGINDNGLAFGAEQIGSVRETSQKDLLEVDGAPPEGDFSDRSVLTLW